MIWDILLMTAAVSVSALLICIIASIVTLIMQGVKKGKE